jgi:hypothetical protein
MIRKGCFLFPVFIFIFITLSAAFGGPSTHSLTVIYSNNLYGTIEPFG